MQMKIQKNIWVYVMIGLFVPFQLLYADQCDEVYNEAKDVYNSAIEAIKQKDFDRAVDLFNEAAEQYEQVVDMENCRCPKIAGISQNKANRSREMADKYQEVGEEYAAELQLYEEYNQAKEKFIEGNAYARNREWDNAIAAFEEAAQIWESVGGATQSENGKRALKSAKQARDAADLARKYQKEQ